MASWAQRLIARHPLIMVSGKPMCGGCGCSIPCPTVSVANMQGSDQMRKEKILALHVPQKGLSVPNQGQLGVNTRQHCVHCRNLQEWPCETVRLLTTDQPKVPVVKDRPDEVTAPSGELPW